MININIDTNNPILLRCNVLQQYSTFVEMVRQNIADDIDDPFTAVQRKEAFDDGISQGELQAKIQTAKNLLNKKIPIEIVIRTTDLPKETIEQLAKNNT